MALVSFGALANRVMDNVEREQRLAAVARDLEAAADADISDETHAAFLFARRAAQHELEQRP